MPTLTPRQKETLDFIRAFIAEHGYSPTQAEIMAHFGIRSHGTVYKHLRILREKGYIRGEWNQKRSIEVVDLDAQPMITPELESAIGSLVTLAHRAGEPLRSLLVRLDRAYAEAIGR